METLNQCGENLNGLFLNSYFIPKEIIIHILSFVDPASLVFRCRIVCKNWKFIIDEYVWKEKIRRTNKHNFCKFSHTEKMSLHLPWYLIYTILCKDPFEKNLMKNNCGQEGFKYWEIIPHWTKFVTIGLHPWKIEFQSKNSDFFPHSEDFGGFKSCFVTSPSPWTRVQIIDLKKWGISDKIMNEFQPIIKASEWYAGEIGDLGIYELTVSLLDSKERVKCEQRSNTILILPSQSGWNKVQFTFTNYGKGVRFIEFKHARDTSCRISGAVVKASSLPTSNLDRCGVNN